MIRYYGEPPYGGPFSSNIPGQRFIFWAWDEEHEISYWVNPSGRIVSKSRFRPEMSVPQGWILTDLFDGFFIDEGL